MAKDRAGASRESAVARRRWSGAEMPAGVGSKGRARIAIVASHVIQYQAPLFAKMAAEPGFDVTVIFCSRDGLKRHRDREMGATFQWDIPLLSGYRHRFLRNLSRQGTSGGFFRAVNPGIVGELSGRRFDAVLFMLGWGVLSAWLGFAACRLRHVPYLIYGDSSFVPADSGVRGWFRKRLLQILFRNAAGFMVSGKLNGAYYRHYGADPAKFFPLPWAIDNERFERDSRMSPSERSRRRAELGFGDEQMVILFSGKLIERKNPLGLLRAFERMSRRKRAALLFLGDGETPQVADSVRGRAWYFERALRWIRQSGRAAQVLRTCRLLRAALVR